MGESVPVGCHSLSLAQRLPHQPTAPERQPTRYPGISSDRSTNPLYHEIGMTLVGQHLMYQSAGIGIDKRRNLPVEVGGEAVADVGQYQALEPILRFGARVELVEWSVERLHRKHHVGI